MAAVRFCLVVLLAEWIGVLVWQFPWAVDSPVNHEAEARAFYAAAYAPGSTAAAMDDDYATFAARAAENFHIADRLRQFIKSNSLEHARVLDVGSGNGKMQDLVDGYTGLDISPSAARFYHKPFVLGTATAMPFKDGEFDAAWSIWVLEHVPNPEAMLSEMRRVVKPGGALYLFPAWDCTPWAADGYDVRPDSDFGIHGRLVKIMMRSQRLAAFQMLYKKPIEFLRSLAPAPTRLHYKRLTPNYQKYWEADSDAVNSLDRMEVARWFKSRGDQLVNFEPGDSGALEIKIAASK